MSNVYFLCVSFVCLEFLVCLVFFFFVTYMLYFWLCSYHRQQSLQLELFADVLGVITLGIFFWIKLDNVQKITSGQLFYLGHIKPKILYLCFLHLRPRSVLMQLAMPLKHFCYRCWWKVFYTFLIFKILLNSSLSPMD